MRCSNLVPAHTALDRMRERSHPSCSTYRSSTGEARFVMAAVCNIFGVVGGRFWVWGLVGRGTYCKRLASHFNWQSLVVTRDSEAVNSGQHQLSFTRPGRHRAFTGQPEVANKRLGADYSQ